MDPNQRNKWIEYWNTNNIWTDSPIWIKNADLFFKSVRPFLNFNPDAVVLDIGCGSGCLIHRLCGHVKKIVGVDTAENYVSLCRKKFNHLRNVETYQLSQDYTNLSFLKPKFTAVVALSVVQYYPRWEEILDLVREVGKIVAPGARFLIADIPCTGNGSKGAVIRFCRMIKAAVKEKYLYGVIRNLYTMYISDSAYRKTVNAYPTIDIPIRKLKKAVVEKLGFPAEIIDRQLTVNVNRTHLLIYY